MIHVFAPAVMVCISFFCFVFIAVECCLAKEKIEFIACKVIFCIFIYSFLLHFLFSWLSLSLSLVHQADISSFFLHLPNFCPLTLRASMSLSLPDSLLLHLMYFCIRTIFTSLCCILYLLYFLLCFIF